MSDDKGARYLTEIMGAPTSVADIWSGFTLVEIDCSARSEVCSGRKILLPLN